MISIDTRLIKLVTRLSIIVALLWYSFFLVKDWEAVKRAFLDVHIIRLIPIILIGMLSNVLFAFVFYLLLSKIEGCRLNFLFAAKILFGGQIVRHIPGRFWHIVYQISKSRELIGTTSLLRANIEYMAISVWATLFIPGAILLYYSNVFKGIAVGIFGLIIFIAGFKRRWHLKAANNILKIIPLPRLKVKLNQLSEIKEVTTQTTIFIMLLVISSWLVYFFVWSILPLAWPRLEGLNLIGLGATYSLAWLVGYLSMIMPSGLGVREAAFVIFAHQLPIESAALILIILRLFLFIVEVGLYLIFLIIPEKELIFS